MGLMILRHIWGRDEKGRLAYCAEFGYRACPRAGNHEVGHGIGEVHPGNEIIPVNLSCELSALLLSIGHKCLYLRLVVLPALPYQLDILSAGTASVNPFHNRPVQRAAAQTAPDYQDMPALRIKSVELHPRLPHFLSGRYYALPYGIAGHHDSVRREKPLHTLVGYADEVSLLSQNLVGQAGESVLLLNQCRHAVSLG